MQKLELPCRIILVIHVAVSLLGYIAFFQADHQLSSPLIPSSVVLQITRHSILAAFIPGLMLIPSLLFYFFQRRAFVMIISSVAVIFYLVQSNYNVIQL